MPATPPDRPRKPWYFALAALSLLSACQTYEPRPLDLPAFDTSLDARTTTFEPVEAFLDRLHDHGIKQDLLFNPADGIDAAEGEVLALFHNPNLRIARLEAGVALADKKTAGLWEDPVFGFDGADILSPSGQPFEWGVGVSFTIPISGRLDVEKDLADTAWKASIRTLIDAEWRTRAALRDAWANWSAAKEQASLIEGTIQRLRALDKQVEHLAELGALNRVERRLFALELASQEASLARAQLDVVRERTELLSLLGLPPDAADLLRPSLSLIPVDVPTDTTARIIAANTELAVQFAKYQVAEETLRMEVRKQYPDIVIGPGYGTEFNDHRVMFGISIPVPLLNANRAGIARAQARREVARASAETTFADLDRRLAASFDALALAREQRRLVEQRIVPLLQNQKKDLDRIAELGEIDMFVVLETINRDLDARTRLVQLRRAECRAASATSLLLGPDRPLPPSPVIVAPAAADLEGDLP